VPKPLGRGDRGDFFPNRKGRDGGVAPWGSRAALHREKVGGAVSDRHCDPPPQKAPWNDLTGHLLLLLLHDDLAEVVNGGDLAPS